MPRLVENEAGHYPTVNPVGLIIRAVNLKDGAVCEVRKSHSFLC